MAKTMKTNCNQQELFFKTMTILSHNLCFLVFTNAWLYIICVQPYYSFFKSWHFADYPDCTNCLFASKFTTFSEVSLNRERETGEKWGGEGKDEGLDILQGREEVTVVCVLKAEGKLLNYRWERLIWEGGERRGGRRDRGERGDTRRRRRGGSEWGMSG